MGQHSCIDAWNEYIVNNCTSEHGGMVQFYKGGYPFMALAKENAQIAFFCLHELQEYNQDGTIRVSEENN